MTTEPPIPPALTPDEWAQLASPDDPFFDRDVVTVPGWGDDEWSRLGWSSQVPGGVYIEEFWSQTSKQRSGSMHIKPSLRHALAALSLHEQPFGFEGDEVNCPAATIVEALRDVADAIDIATGPKMIGVVHIVGPSGRASIGAFYTEMFRACADRIEALLPPPPP